MLISPIVNNFHLHCKQIIKKRSLRIIIICVKMIKINANYSSYIRFISTVKAIKIIANYSNQITFISTVKMMKKFQQSGFCHLHVLQFRLQLPFLILDLEGLVHQCLLHLTRLRFTYHCIFIIMATQHHMMIVIGY